MAAAVALYRALLPRASAAELKQALLADTDRVAAFAGRSVTGGRLSLARIGDHAGTTVRYAFSSMTARAGTVTPAIGISTPPGSGRYTVDLGLGMEDGGEIWALAGKPVTLGGVTGVVGGHGDARFDLGSFPDFDGIGLTPSVELGAGRYVLTAQGLSDMKAKYKAHEFGPCPRSLCEKQTVLPTGLSDSVSLSGDNPMKLFCAKCQELYDYNVPGGNYIDGAFFGTTFPHLFMQTFHELRPTPSTAQYIPRVFGFKVHKAPEAQAVVGRLVKMGCRASLTCAPYFLPSRPQMGEIVAWAESNAVLYADPVQHLCLRSILPEANEDWQRRPRKCGHSPCASRSCELTTPCSACFNAS